MALKTPGRTGAVVRRIAFFIIALLVLSSIQLTVIAIGGGPVSVQNHSRLITYQAPFDFSLEEAEGGIVGRLVADSDAGSMEQGIYLDTLQDDWVIHGFTGLGARHQTYASQLVPAAYSAEVTASLTYRGVISCEGSLLSTDAQVTATLLQERWTGSGWEQVASKTIFQEGCNFLRLDDQHIEDGMVMTFDADETYRFVVRIAYEAQVFMGDDAVTILFCTEWGFCDDWGGTGWTLNSIKIENQRPVAHFYDTSVGYAQNLIFGVDLEGLVCDIDGNISYLEFFWVGQPRYGVGNCLSHSHNHRFLTPGSYEIGLYGEDDQGLPGYDTGWVNVELVGNVGGEMLPQKVGQQVIIVDLLGERGELLGRRVFSDGALVYDGPPVQPGDVFFTSRMELDRGAMEASFFLGGELEWRGRVVQLGEKWWDLFPACAPQVDLVEWPGSGATCSLPVPWENQPT